VESLATAQAYQAFSHGDGRLVARSAMTWQASQQFEAGDFVAAGHAYRAVLDEFPDDSVARFMLEQCKARRTGDSLESTVA
jgi:hypothetical protein